MGRIIACLLRGLPDPPGGAEDYKARINTLAAYHWIGDFARAIPRGWLPVCERTVRVGVALLPPSTLQSVATVMLWERFGRLDWVIGGHIAQVNAMTAYVRQATNFACMGCSRIGARDGGPGQRILTLCDEHRRLRYADEPAFRLTLYPAGVPELPHVKL